MNDQPLSYRFFSIERSGEVEVDDEQVRAEVRQGFTRSKFVTPLACLHPYPLRMWTTSSTALDCLFVGILAILFTIGGLITGDFENVGGNWYLLAIGIGGAVLLALAVWLRREEWVTFTSKISAYGIWYCRGGLDRESFDALTEELSSRIKECSV